MKAILVVRRFDDFSRILTENNFEVINLPLIETRMLNDLSDLETKLAQLEKYDGIFLTSATAAQILRAKLAERQLVYPGKVYVLGRRGFDILKTANLDLAYDESAQTAREMLEKIAPEDLDGKRFLFVRGAKSLRIVPEFLAQSSKVDEAIVYETLCLKVEAGQAGDLRERFEKNEIAASCFFSPSAAQVFLEQFGAEITHQTKIATIGKTTAEFFWRSNLEVNFVSSKATAKDFALGLIGYLRKI